LRRNPVRAIVRHDVQQQLGVLLRLELHARHQGVPNRTPHGRARGRDVSPVRQLGVAVREAYRVARRFRRDFARLLPRVRLRLLYVGEVGGEAPADIECEGYASAVGDAQRHGQRRDTRAVLQTDVERAVRNAARVGGLLVTRHASATAAEARQLRVYEVEPQNRRGSDAGLAQPWPFAIDGEDERGEVARFTEVEPGQRHIRRTLSSPIHDEQRLPLPRVQLVRPDLDLRHGHTGGAIHMPASPPAAAAWPWLWLIRSR